MQPAPNFNWAVKHRPLNIDDFVGQTAAIHIITKFLQGDENAG
jgi:hypothetical protein